MSEVDYDAQDLIAFLLENEADIPSGKSRSISSFYGSIDGFLNENFTSAQLSTREGRVVRLTQDQRQAIENSKSKIVREDSTRRNWIRLLAGRFISVTQYSVRNLNLSKMNVNPFIVRSLKLHTPLDVVKFNVYQSVTRSIVTSMGFTLETLLVKSGARKVSKKETGFDLVKDLNELEYWIQIKSGTNDMDADQIRFLAGKASTLESEPNKKARLGMAYGNKNQNTVSLGLIKQYLPNWEERLLVGRELWEFISQEPNYHETVLKVMDTVANRIITASSIAEEIEEAVKRITNEFIASYGEGSAGVDNFIEKSL